MKEKLNNLIKLLLELHKKLLDLERAAYEKKNGSISNNHEYFQLVVNHDDFRWLRALSEIIASLDLESEKAELDDNQIKVLFENIKTLFGNNDESEFCKRYQYFFKQDLSLVELEARVLADLSK